MRHHHPHLIETSKITHQQPGPPGTHLHPRFLVSCFRFNKTALPLIHYKYTLSPTLSFQFNKQLNNNLRIHTKTHTYTYRGIYRRYIWRIWTEYGQQRRSPSSTATPITAARRWSPVSGQSSTDAGDSRRLRLPAPITSMSGRFRASPAPITAQQLWIAAEMRWGSKLMIHSGKLCTWAAGDLAKRDQWERNDRKNINRRVGWGVVRVNWSENVTGGVIGSD